jgi:protoheme IX farnesyltransferase
LREHKGIAAETAVTSLGARLHAYVELAKFRLSALAVFAVVAGAFMGWPVGYPPAGIVIGTTIGTFLVAAGAAALNMHHERELDARMERTRERPLPSGRVQPEHAFGFGIASSGLGLLVLLLASNVVATLVCAAIVLGYVLVYTPMKVRTPLNTLVGAIPGALPPVVGYAAVTGRIAMPAVVLFLILFCWQIPHFLAIAWRYREDYRAGGFQMWPVVDPSGARTRRVMLVYVAGLGIASMIPFVMHMAGEIYLGAAVCLDLLFFAPAVTAACTRWESAMRMTFLASLAYLPLLLGVMVFDRVVPT